MRPIAAALGVAPWTLHRWTRASNARSGFRPVQVIAAEQAADAAAMRWHGRRITVYAYARPTDMRKGFDGLRGLVTQGLQHDPLNGDLYIFVSRDRVRAKVLHWDGTGLRVYAKRLERGRFASLWRADDETPITLTVGELDLFLEGRTMVGRVALSPPALTHFSLASDRAG